MDEARYAKYQKEQIERFEGVCRRCGECCGSQDGDPCANLSRDAATGGFYCADYDNRLGPQKTVSGRMFNCVPIRGIKRMGLLRLGCAYSDGGI